MPGPKGSSTQIVLNSLPYLVTNYVADEVPPLPPQTRSGPLSYVDVVGEETVPQLTWHKGFGRGEIRDTRELGRYHYTTNVDCRFRGAMTLGPLINSTTITNAEAKVQFIEYNGSWFAIGARYVAKLNGTNWDTDKDMGATASAVKGAATVFGGNLYVGAGSAVDFWMRDSAGTWTQPAAGQKATLMASVGANIWLTLSGNQLKSSTDGITWLTAVSVGSSLDVATSLFDYNGFPHIGKPDGLFFYDGTAVSNAVPEIALRRQSTNCKGAAVARGRVLVPAGGTVIGYSADSIVLDALHPSIDRSSSTETRGSFVEFWPDADFAWAVFAAQSGTYYLLAYDFNPEPGAGWHTVVSTGSTAVTALGIQASASPPRLWYSVGTAIKYVLLPANGMVPTQDSNYRYAASGTFVSAIELDDFDDNLKSHISFLIETASCTSGRPVQLSVAMYGDDGALISGVPFAGPSTAGDIASNGMHEYGFSLKATQTARRLIVTLTLITNDSTLSPAVLFFGRRFQRRFPRRRRWTFDVLAGRAGGNTVGSRKEQIVALETVRTATDAITFIDDDGRSYSVFMEFLGDSAPQGDSADGSKSVHVVLTERREYPGVGSSAGTPWPL